MSDTSMIFNLLGRDGVSKALLMIRRQVNNTADAVERVGKSEGFQSLNKGVDVGAAKMVKLARAASLVATAMSGAQSAVGVAVALSGTLGLIPAAAVAGGVAMAALKVGVAGFGAAVKDSGDPKKFAADLKTLAPAAAATALELKALHPQLAALKKDVQGSLFAGFAGQLKTIAARYLPTVRTNLSGVAGSFNQAARSTGQYLARGAQVGMVSRLLGQARATAANLAPALRPAVSILLNLASAGGSFLPQLTSTLVGAANAAARFVSKARQTGQLHDWISVGLSAVKQLGQVLGNVGAIVAQVFGSFSSAGAGVLPMLVRLTDQVRAFLASAKGQQVLHALASVLGTVSRVVSQVLMVALHQAVPIVLALAPAFGQLAQQAGGALVSALNTAGPLLLHLAGWVAQNIHWLGPLALGLAGAVKAFQAVTAAMKVLKLVTSTNPWVLLITVTVALVTLIVTHWNKIKNFVVNAVHAVIGWVKAHWPLLVGILLGPLGVIVALVVTHWHQVQQVTMRVISAVVSWVRARIRDVLNFFAFLGSLPGRVAGWFGRVKDAAVQRLTGLISWVRGLPGRILHALGHLGGLLVNAGRDIVSGLWHGIERMAGWLIGKVTGWIKSVIPGPIARALGIASPSKVAAALAEQVPRGIPIGLERTSGVAVAAARRLAGRVREGLGDMVVAGQVTATGSAAAGSGSRSGAGTGGGTLKVLPGADQAVATMIMHLVRSGKLQLVTT